MTVPFLILAVLTIAGAVAAMTLRKLIHCALALAVSLIGLAGLFLDLGVQFVGLVQVLVYVGAVVILIVFAILLTRADEIPTHGLGRAMSGVVVSACVFGVLAWAVVSGGAAVGAGQVVSQQGAISGIGYAMMQRFILPLEVVGLLLTAALIGAVVIAMEEKRTKQ